MAEVGVVLVGSDLPSWTTDRVPVRRIDATPPRRAPPASARDVAARALFDGADADRWHAVPAEGRSDGALLWVVQAVQTHSFESWMPNVERVLVVGWVDELALVPTIRQIGLPCCVMLLGHPAHRDLARVQATHAVLAQLVRDRQVSRVWTVTERVPQLSVWVPIAITLSEHASAAEVGAPVELDPGPWLELPSVPLFGAPPVPFDGLTRVELGRTGSLGRAALLASAHDVLRQLCDAEPGFRPTTELPPHDLPDLGAADRIGDEIRRALAQVQLRGTEPLVDQLEHALRPVAAQVDRVCEAITAAERARLAGLQTFPAYGIFRTVEGLREALAGIAQLYPAEHLRGLALLLDGTPDSLEDSDQVHVNAWRRAFAGLPSGVFPRGAPGARLARRLVRERFAQFRTSFAAEVSAHVHALLTRARDPDAPASSVELGLLLQRAERVQDAVLLVCTNLRDRAHADAEAAMREDPVSRSVSRDPGQLVDALRGNRAGASALRARFTDVLRGFRVGPLQSAPFEDRLRALVAALHEVPDQVPPPSYGQTAGAIVGDTQARRFATVVGGGGVGEVHVGADLADADELVAWLATAGFPSRRVPTPFSTVIVWRPYAGRRGPAPGRRATTEHRLKDLLLPDPGGDSVAWLIALARSITVVLAAVAVGQLRLRPLGGGNAWQVDGAGLEDPVPPVLPVDLVVRLAHREGARDALERAVVGRLDALATAQHAAVPVGRLLDLVRRGVPPRMRAQLGFEDRYARVLDTLVPPLLSRLLEPVAARVRAVVSRSPQRPWTDLTETGDEGSEIG